MITYLVSSPGGQYIVNGQRVPTNLNNENGFVDHLKSHWKEKSRGLIVSSSPDNSEVNDSIKHILEQSCSMSGLSIMKFDVCDHRSIDLVDRISEYDVVILSGGHVPTQNNFFQKINLKRALTQFEGILIGISAGTMNSAEIVYAQPELQGESSNPEYKRFLPGLGITKLMILPHYQDVKDEILDGKRVMEDITYPDSYGREFYAIVDGSYVLMENGVQTLFGEGYLVTEGSIRRICEINKHINIGEVY